ncbi:Bile acid 7-alpha dehydratase [Pandoraea terrae]|uniref:Bile acid 7-alpha dehydratase n=1 Tax=Pandoraea terrae TaxID=1537710 RepID=A0A5E4ZCF7_9BURK|nr:nuclear transport factor 2 family protein [Pandoraea terrae]VVE58357.1 Bile acid 7-alpha dehydratase [Pandoraea terrae]
MTDHDIAARVRRLEDIEAIRRLKARYLACCDAKDPAGMRECFVPGEVHIDYGNVGVFDNREALVDVFTRLGCVDHIIEMHHGVNPQIALTGDDEAQGTWGLHFQRIDTQAMTLLQLGAVYEDRYRRVGDEWRMSATRCVPTSTLVLKLDPAQLSLVLAARQAG